jgi:hypothetical protein
VFEGNGDIGGRHDVELRTIAFFSALPQFQSRAVAAVAAGVSGVARLGFVSRATCTPRMSYWTRVLQK